MFPDKAGPGDPSAHDCARRSWWKRRRHDSLFWTAAAVVALAVFQLLTLERVERPGLDSSIYMLGAESLARHRGYEMDGVRITTHPPGFPLLMAIPVRISGDAGRDFFLRCMPLFGACGLLAWLSVLARLAGPRVAAAVILLIATSPVYFHMATRYVMADLPYLLLSGLAAHTALRATAAQGRLGAGGWGAASALWAALAALTRSAGISLGAAFLGWALLPQRFWSGEKPALRARLWLALAGAAALAVVAGWLFWSKSVENREEMGGHMASYSSQFFHKDPLHPDLGRADAADLALRLARNAPLRSAQMAEVVLRLPWVADRWFHPAVFALLVLPLAALRRMRRDPLLMLVWLYFAAYLALFLLWPFAETARFVLPIAPAWMLVAWIGGLEAASVVQRWRPRMLAGVLGLIGAAAAWDLWTSADAVGIQERAALIFWPLAAGSVLVWSRLGPGLAGKIRSHAEKTAVPCALAVLLAAGLAGQARASLDNLHPDPARYPNSYLFEAVAWLRQAGTGAVMSSNFAYVHRMTQRKTVALPVTGDAGRIYAAILRHRVRFVIVTHSSGENTYFHPPEQARIAAVQTAWPGLLTLVHTGRGWSAYEVAAEVWNQGERRTVP